MKKNLLLIAGVLAAGVAIAASRRAEPLEGGVDPKRIQAISAMLGDEPFGFGSKIDDRAAWKRLASTKAYATVVREAEKLLDKPMAEMTEEVYMLFKQTGRRTAEYNRVRRDRYGRVVQYTLAECLENKGRFVKPLEAVLRAICEEKTWIYNFHDASLANYHGKTVSIDLGSADLAQNLGACLWLLGDRLSAETRQQVMARLRERIFEPYRRAVEGVGSRQGWITSEANWNAVCHAGVVAAALAVCDDRSERAFFVAAAEKYSQDYLRGFGGDGYCAEGMGYWNYGFGHYIQLCETVYQATRGQLDLYHLPGAREAALYPVRIRLFADMYPAYADCSVNARPDFRLMSYINRRYELGLKEFVLDDFATVSGGLPSALMYSCPNSATARPMVDGREFYEIRSFFPNGDVLNGRPLPGSACRMAVSFKGGHNAEPHNHNDLGSFVVAVGREMLILDPGGEVYTARTFSKDRYKSNLLNSYGHPVPVVAGQLQRTGAAARAVVVATNFTETVDTYTLDLRSAYDVPSLQTLTREFIYNRAGTGSLTVTDEFAFDSPRTFGSALVTYSRWKQLSPTELLIYGEREAVKIGIHAGGAPFTIADEVIEEENPSRTRPTRLGINLTEPQAKGRLVFTITTSAAE